ncbi:hypothetical protein IWW50_002773 [Coemansia erecta]|nr:hypothetical protein IWW50_002773 [Coemansia erecta]
MQLTTARLRSVGNPRKFLRVYVKDYLKKYLKAAGLQPQFRFNIIGAGQLASFQVTDMVMDYHNSVANQFENLVRHTVNLLLNAKQHDQDIKDEMRARGRFTKTQITQACNRAVWGPAWQLKESLQHLRFFDVMPTEQTAEARALLQPFVDLYLGGYKLKEADLFDDAVVHPERHLHGFYMLSHILESCRF